MICRFVAIPISYADAYLVGTPRCGVRLMDADGAARRPYHFKMGRLKISKKKLDRILRAK